MQTQALNQDEQHEFTGVTVKVISVSGIKSEIDGAQVFVRVKCHDKNADTRKKVNDRDTVTFDENFFYNTTEILDDDVVFELYQLIQGQGISKNLVGSKASQSRLGNSKVYDADGKFLGATKVTQISRLKRQSQEKSLDLLSEKNTVIGKINVGFDFLERQDIVGGIRCPNLSLKPGSTQKKLTLENKYAAYKNLYSFLDGNQTPNCEFFPRKFHH